MHSLVTFARLWLKKFLADETPTLAASLAFYTAVSMAPLMVIFVSVTSHLDTSLQSQFAVEAQRFLGADTAAALMAIIHSAAQTANHRILTRTLGGLTVLISAGFTFGQLRVILNRIFRNSLSKSVHRSWLQMTGGFLGGRFRDVVWALSFVGLLTTGLWLAGALSTHGDWPHWLLPLRGADSIISWAVYFVSFVLLFRYLPDGRLSWFQVGVGAALTGGLFMVGNWLIGVYLANSPLASPYGAAGSLVVLLIWVYYSALITFVGAQFAFLLRQPATTAEKPAAPIAAVAPLAPRLLK